VRFKLPCITLPAAPKLFERYSASCKMGAPEDGFLLTETETSIGRQSNQERG
jgi:hypothetical protein